MNKLVYNNQYNMLGILNEATGLVRIDEEFTTLWMVYLDYTWSVVGEL